MHHFASDVRSGRPDAVKYPTLSIVAILTLGLGIGLSTTVFCVVNGGLFKGLPFPDADRIVSLVGDEPVAAAAAAAGQRPGPGGVPGAADLVRADRRVRLRRRSTCRNEDGRPERFSGGQLTVGGVRGARRAADPRPRLPRRRRSARRRSGDPARLSPLARAIRRRAGHRRQDDPRQRRAAHRDRRDAGEVRAFRSARRCGSRWRSIRWPSRAARVRTIR